MDTDTRKITQGHTTSFSLVWPFLLPILPSSTLLFQSDFLDRFFRADLGQLSLGLLVGFFMLWILFAFQSYIKLRRSGEKDPIKRDTQAFFLGIFLTGIPMLLAAILWFSSPPIHFGSWLLFAYTSLFPCVHTAIWCSVDEKFLTTITAARIMSCSILIVLLLGIFEILFRLVGLPESHFLPEGYSHIYTKANSPDRTYWYYTGLLQPNVKVTPNSWGFMGPEPDQWSQNLKILLLGDRLGLGGTNPVTLPENFATISQSMLSETDGFQSPIAIINASMPAYSTEQIVRFYKEKLKGLSHNILILVFHLDDINRELSYRKKHVLYSPKWPEWMQDFYYYGCYSCKWVLSRIHFTHKTFQWYRGKTYEEAFPKALQILSTLKVEAKNRGATFAILNVPRFYWNGTLKNPDDYIYKQMNRDLQAWCAKQHVPLFDVLPQLVGKNADDYVLDSKLSFTEKGHRLMAEYLRQFILTLISEQHTTPSQPEMISTE